jgi:hypothetical protein
MATLEKIFERAAQFGNRHNRSLEYANAFIRRAYGPCTFGIESVSLGDRELYYLNTGDTYSITVAQEGERGKLEVTSWGDWYEEAEEETGTIRCGWCSYYTPMDQDNWHDVVCESCRHHVDGNN